MNRLKALLMHGYFPVQLPPAFTTTQFARKYKKFEAVWNAEPLPSSESERFSVARSSYNRRITRILNPVAFYGIAKAVSDYWPKIQNHFSKSRFSFSRPKFSPGIRAIKINRFSDIHDHRILASAGYRYALVTDISRFFPTIYTHAIPWALHGKSVAKRHRSPTPAYYGNILDRASRQAQDGQTLGLPVGPDTSHVIAEIIGTRMDVEIRDRLGGWPKGFRYVDDFYLFFNSRQEAENALPVIVKSATMYELQINPQKTRIIETREMVEESWKYKLKRFPLSSRRSRQRDQIHAFFETLLALERAYKDESVVKYGLKLISSKIIKKSNWTEFEAYLLHCGFAYPNSLQVIASILSTYSLHDYPLDRRAIARFCNAIVSSHARLDNHSEIAWALWIMIELALELTPLAASELRSLASPTCIVLAMSILKKQSTAGRGKFDARVLRQHATTDALRGEGWLLAYEAGRRCWLGNSDNKYIMADKYFRELLMREVSFFDESARLPAIFSPKQPDTFDPSLFESDVDVDSFFEFDEADEEYFDKGSEDDDDEHEAGGESTPDSDAAKDPFGVEF